MYTKGHGRFLAVNAAITPLLLPPHPPRSILKNPGKTTVFWLSYPSLRQPWYIASAAVANQFLGMNGDAERNRKKGSFQLLAPTFQFLAPTSQWKGNRKCTKSWLRFFDISKLTGINAIRKPLAYNLWHATKPNGDDAKNNPLNANCSTNFPWSLNR